MNDYDDSEICRGRKPVLDLLAKNPSRCAKLLIANNVRPPFLDELVDMARREKITYQLVAPEALDKLSGGEKHQGVICKLTQAKAIDLEDFLRGIEGKTNVLAVVLDHIEDPHNLGAIIRSAEAGCASCVIYAKRRSAFPNGTVIKTSAGASLRLPVIQVVNIARTIDRLKEFGFWSVGLDEDSDKSIWTERLPERTALVVGAEGFGLSRLVSEKCDMLMKIPIMKDGTGSLNASVAAALGIFEWTRTYGI
ncbi:MAG: 23S rRNA (guanosine(2251)-2'-O)-methyltransferase RlmB [Synergistaceae bacterium]|nr:23S rRNA (guanosine(2251)-2'-O)-methyltransferase RlmB [Synergistaceae bacterium]MBR0250926.1 23S rRNA (guanosine(2251)-2'-O)-methyltransferase RlmB [Synergistaceae bacterium]